MNALLYAFTDEWDSSIDLFKRHEAAKLCWEWSPGKFILETSIAFFIAYSLPSNAERSSIRYEEPHVSFTKPKLLGCCIGVWIKAQCKRVDAWEFSIFCVKMLITEFPWIDTKINSGHLSFSIDVYRLR